MADKTLFDDKNVRSFNPIFAIAVGTDLAIIAQHIYFLCYVKSKDPVRYRDGYFPDENRVKRWWTYNTMEDWHDLHFPYMSLRVLEREIKKGKEIGIIIIRPKTIKGVRLSTWYTIDTAVCDRLLAEANQAYSENYAAKFSAWAQRETEIIHYEIELPDGVTQGGLFANMADANRQNGGADNRQNGGLSYVSMLSTNTFGASAESPEISEVSPSASGLGVSSLRSDTPVVQSKSSLPTTTRDKADATPLSSPLHKPGQTKDSNQNQSVPLGPGIIGSSNGDNVDVDEDGNPVKGAPQRFTKAEATVLNIIRDLFPISNVKSLNETEKKRLKRQCQVEGTMTFYNLHDLWEKYGDTWGMWALEQLRPVAVVYKQRADKPMRKSQIIDELHKLVPVFLSQQQAIELPLTEQDKLNQIPYNPFVIRRRL